MRAPSFLTLPNLLSLSRFPMAAAFVLANGTPARLALLGTASATDMLDGWLARRLGATRIGALLDPLADKTFMVAALSAFLVGGHLGLGAYLLILSRDLATAVGFIVAWYLPGLDPAAFQARLPGKVVTVLQLLALLVLLVAPSYLRALLPAIALTSLWAIGDYTAMLHRTRVRR